jgi:hypothetical protein
MKLLVRESSDFVRIVNLLERFRQQLASVVVEPLGLPMMQERSFWYIDWER